MMNSATLRLVLLVSCAHGLVHVYEHSLSSVEQLATAEAEFEIPQDDQKKVSGVLGNCLRMPMGFCALLAGWLADRYGAKRLLLIYLWGCCASALVVWLVPNLGMLYLGMFVLGLFASIYHPAGVALISHHTTPANRPMALGYHGIFGSVGIAIGPLLAGLALNAGATWRQYYLVLALPGALLAVLFLLWFSRLEEDPDLSDRPRSPAARAGDARWSSFVVLMLAASLAGFVYAAILNFLPRYLGDSGLSIAGLPPESLRNYLTGSLLLLGVLGQYTAGRIARPATLEPLLALAFLVAAPCALWMGFAQGISRVWAAGLFVPVFFMHQPLYNSLVAKYVPRRRRSLCYGVSFTVGFGVGSFGPTFAGHVTSDRLNYGTLGGLLVLAGILSLLLWRRNRTLDGAGPPASTAGSSSEDASEALL